MLPNGNVDPLLFYMNLRQAGSRFTSKIGVALKSAAEGFYGGLYGDELAVPGPVMIDPSNFRGLNTPMLFEQDGNGYNYFRYENYSSSVIAYERCPPVAAIINRKAQTFVNGRTWVLNNREKEAQGGDADKMRNLLDNPNPLQSGMDFEAQGYIFNQLFGFNIILPIKPVGFTDNLDATTLWNIPASMIDIQATQEAFTNAGGIGLTTIWFNFNGRRIEFAVEDLIIIKDFTPSFSLLTFPGSKLKAMTLPINNIIGAYESRHTLINYRGALGILSSDAGSGMYAPIAMSPQEKEDLQRDFKRYGLRSRQWQVIMTTASLKWQQMGYATKDLMLMEEVEESTRAICAGSNFPPFILGLADTTYNNMNAAEKGLYQNATIPDANNYYSQLTTAFGLRKRNLHLNKDFNHIPVLQDDKEAAGRARMYANQAYEMEFRYGLLTIDAWLEKNGEDPRSDGVGKLYFPEYVARFGDPQKPVTNGQQTTEQNGQAQATNVGTGTAPASQQ